MDKEGVEGAEGVEGFEGGEGLHPNYDRHPHLYSSTPTNPTKLTQRNSTEHTTPVNANTQPPATNKLSLSCN